MPNVSGLEALTRHKVSSRSREQVQLCASECLTAGFLGKKSPDLFTSFHGVNTPTVVGFGLSRGDHRTRTWKEMSAIVPCGGGAGSCVHFLAWEKYQTKQDQPLCH